MSSNNIFKSGFISLIGRPNVGKSTLINSLVGEKISAVSNKPNTTRNRIVGIKNFSDAQLIFLDTPGIHKAHGKLAKSMVQAANNATAESDIIIFITDVERAFGKADKYIIENLNKPTILVINKIDRVSKPQILEIITEASSFEGKFEEIIPVSALHNDGTELLLNVLKDYLPEGPKYFPDEMYTDQPEVFLVSEFIREKIFNLTHQEIPYKTAVKVEEFNENPSKNIIRIAAEVYVERKNHKGIIIGKNGEMLKKIASEARVEIEKILGTKIFLEIWVKVKENWTQSDHEIKQFGYGNIN